MKLFTKKYHFTVLIGFYVFIWILANLFFLDSFPFIHSDEVWLAGITQTMLEGGTFAVTEPFFDLQPRTVHGLRLIFHTLQAPFLLLLHYSPTGFRGLSLASGAAVLLLFFSLLKKMRFSGIHAFFGVLFLSLDMQFLYASRFGRQEILLLLFMTGGLLLFTAVREKSYSGPVTGILTGLAAGVHPNSFVIAWPVSLLFFIDLLRKKRSAGDFFLFVASAALSAGFFVIISLLMNRNFFREYLEYGLSVGVRTGAAERFTDFFPFLGKLFTRTSGTYYTPPVQIQLILLPVLTLRGIFVLLRGKFRQNKTLYGVTGVLGITLGLIILGKYSQLSIIFYFPFLYILLLDFLSELKLPKEGIRNVFLIFTACFSLLMSLRSISTEVKQEGRGFNEYIETLRRVVPENSRVLANLNGGTAFGHSRFLDWRNLAFLDSRRMTVPEYIRSRNIEYIIYPEELDYIYRSRPMWNIMYGNLYPWYEEMGKFLRDSCVLEHSFSSPGYAMRVTALRFKKDWDIRIYRVLPPL